LKKINVKKFSLCSRFSGRHSRQESIAYISVAREVSKLKFSVDFLI